MDGDFFANHRIRICYVNLIRFFVAGFVFGIAFPHAGADGTDYSDLVAVSGNSFLTVNDRKNPIHAGFRVGLLSVTRDKGIIFQPITVSNWRDREQAPSDLEACCAIPNRPNEFLLAESGCYNGKFGRIFHVLLTTCDAGPPSIVVLGVMRIYERKLDDRQRSFDGDNVVGIECFEAFGKTILVYGERGGQTHSGTKPGTIVWGELDLNEYQFKKIGESALVPRSFPGYRDCSALYLVADEKQRVSIFSVATTDPDDNGPFDSFIYRAGSFVLDTKSSAVTFEMDLQPTILATVPGLKVEGLAGPASNVPNSDFSIATDDENLGGVWRPVFVGDTGLTRK